MRTLPIVVTTLWVLVPSCCSPPPASGEVYVSAVSVTDWAVYGSRFQPRFSLSEAEALAAAVADTAQIEQSELDVRSLGVRAKVLQGSTDLIDAGEVAAPAAAPPITPAKSILDASKVAVDPRLQYLLATALWQEVQVLNRYVLDALQFDTDTVPYLVRLQVSSHPDSVESSYMQDVKLTFRADGKEVDVVPLLINDHIEAALASRRDEETRRLSIGIAAMLKGVGAGIDLDSYLAKLDQSLARELNGLLSVAKSGRGTLQVRLGARRIGDDAYVATTEPRFLTVLVLFRKAEKQAATEFRVDRPPTTKPMEVTVSYTATLRDPVSGKVLTREAGGRAAAREFVVVGRWPDSPWLRAEQTALAFDDGDTTVVTLNDATGFLPDQVVATWFFKAGTSQTLHALASGAIEYDGANRQLRFTFPSLRRYGIEPRADGVPPRFERRELARAFGDRVAEIVRERAEDGTTNNTHYSSAGFALPENGRSAMHATPERSFMVKLLDRERTAVAPPGGEKISERVYLFYPWVYKAQDKQKRSPEDDKAQQPAAPGQQAKTGG